MKQKIGIGLLIILNLTFIYVIVMGAMVRFALIVAPLGQDKGLEVASRTTNDILINLSIISVVVLLINYLLTKKLIRIKRPFFMSLAITFIGIIVFIPFFLSARQSFLNYQNGTTSFNIISTGEQELISKSLTGHSLSSKH
jgi:hypothetical protein